jgi:hypothetical protein
MFSLTPGVLRMTASTAALVSFVESSSLLRELAGVEVSASQVEPSAEALGAEIAADERTCVEPTGEVAPTMYLGMDPYGRSHAHLRGCRSRWQTVRWLRQDPRGQARHHLDFWTAESWDDQGKPMRDPGAITCSAAIESAAAHDINPERSDFAERVLREATRRGFTEALRCALLGDGSTWIWKTGHPKAIPILDRYHAKETLHRTAQSIFGAPSQNSKPWATGRCAELDDGKLSAIVHALRPHMTSSNEATTCAMYIIHNRRRMRYPKFHAQGLCTSTGVLEVGARSQSRPRLKRSGAHWAISRWVHIKVRYINTPGPEWPATL